MIVPSELVPSMLEAFRISERDGICYGEPVRVCGPVEPKEEPSRTGVALVDYDGNKTQVLLDPAFSLEAHIIAKMQDEVQRLIDANWAAVENEIMNGNGSEQKPRGVIEA